MGGLVFRFHRFLLLALVAGCYPIVNIEIASCGGHDPDQEHGDTANETGVSYTTTVWTTGWTDWTVPTSSDLACSDSLSLDAQTVFTNTCSACHGPDSPKYDGYGDALDPVAMIADGWVVPGDSADSKVYQQVSPGPGGEPPRMLTAEGGGPLVPNDILIVRSWIDCGAQDWTGLSSTGFDHATLPPEDTCESCHEADRPAPDHYAGQDCASCHQTDTWVYAP